TDPGIVKRVVEGALHRLKNGALGLFQVAQHGLAKKFGLFIDIGLQLADANGLGHGCSYFFLRVPLSSALFLVPAPFLVPLARTSSGSPITSSACSKASTAWASGPSSASSSMPNFLRSFAFSCCSFEVACSSSCSAEL